MSHGSLMGAGERCCIRGGLDYEVSKQIKYNLLLVCTESQSHMVFNLLCSLHANTLFRRYAMSFYVCLHLHVTSHFPLQEGL